MEYTASTVRGEIVVARWQWTVPQKQEQQNFAMSIQVTVDLKRDAKGLGILMDKKGKPPNQRIWVDEIVAGTPAASCGKIEVGDTLLEVNGQEVDKMTFEAVMTELKKDDVQLKFDRKPVASVS